MRAPLFLLLSSFFHLLVIGLLLARAPLRASDAVDAPNPAWFEVARTAIEEPRETPPAPPEPPPSAKPQRALREPRLRPTRGPRTAGTNENHGGIPEGEGTMTVGPAGDGLASGAADGDATDPSESAPPAKPEPPSKPEPHRERRPAQLSLWIDPKQFEHVALVRPGTAVLMAVPGFRDVLRGSNIRPFHDLDQLRVTLAGTAPEQLMVAGVHSGGEPAVRDAARRIAAMRRQEPIWRGDSTLAATSWVDGTSVDRGLALQAGAFLIGARASMPALLGDAPAETRVQEASRLRRRVLFLLTLEDAPLYVPGVRKCALAAFRLSIASQADTARMSLQAEYDTNTAAQAASACLRTLGDASPVSELLAWLVRSQVAPKSNRTQLAAEVTNAQIESLLDGLAWILRTAGR